MATSGSKSTTSTKSPYSGQTASQARANIQQKLSEAKKSAATPQTGGRPKITFTDKSGRVVSAEIKSGETPEQTIARYSTVSNAPQKLSQTELSRIATQKGAALNKGALQRFETTASGDVVARYSGGSYVFPQGYASQQVITDRYGNPIDITGKSEKQIEKAMQDRERSYEVKQYASQVTKRLAGVRERIAKGEYVGPGSQGLFFKGMATTTAGEVGVPSAEAAARGEAGIFTFSELSKEEQKNVIESYKSPKSEFKYELFPYASTYYKGVEQKNKREISKKVETYGLALKDLASNFGKNKSSGISSFVGFLTSKGGEVGSKYVSAETITKMGTTSLAVAKIPYTIVVGDTKKIIKSMQPTITYFSGMYGKAEKKASAFTSKILPSVEGQIKTTTSFFQKYPELLTPAGSLLKSYSNYKDYGVRLPIGHPLIPGTYELKIFPEKIKERIIPSAVSYSAGLYEGVRTEPLKTAATFGTFYVLPLGLKYAGKVVAPVASLFPKTSRAIEVTAAVGLTGLYGTSIFARAATSKNAAFELGKITSTEILPMMAGGILGGKTFSNIENYITIKKEGSKFVQPYKTVRFEVLTGEQTFPTSKISAKVQLAEFESGKYILPTERTLFYKEGKVEYGYHVTPEKLPSVTKWSAGSSELPGGYISSEASIYFAKLTGASSSIYSTKILQGYGTPRIIRQKVSGFELFPKGAKGTQNMAKFLIEESEFGKAYVPGIKTEIEAIIKPGTVTELKDIPFYTRVPKQSFAAQFEKLQRGGRTERVLRVQKFSLTKPSTYLDKFMGRKAGTFKYFGFKRKGTILPIERRYESIKQGTLGGIFKGLKGSYSYKGAYYIASSPLGYGLLSLKNISYGKGSKISSYKLSSKTSYGVSSKSYSSSSISKSVSSYKLSSGKLSYMPSSKTSRSSYSLYSPSSIKYSPSYKSSVSSGRSGSIMRLTRKTTTEIPLIPYSFRGKEKKKPKKQRAFGRPFKYTSTIAESSLNIYGKKPKFLTGVEARPLIRR